MWEIIETLLEFYQIIGVAIFISLAFFILFNHTRTFK